MSFAFNRQGRAKAQHLFVVFSDNTGSVCHLFAVLVTMFSIGPFTREIIRDRAMVHDTRTLRGESVAVGLGFGSCPPPLADRGS
jgi:hypothetical protein